MLPGKYEPGPVIEATLRIYVNGVERPHISASWEGNTTGGLPESLVAAGDDIYSRTGKVTWAPGSAVTLHPLAPVGETRWTPQHGDKIYIEAEVGGVKFPRFTGYLGASTYDLTEDQVTTKITDGLGAALQTIMSVPPGLGRYLRSSWVAYRAIEQAGLGILPPVTADTVLQDAYQGGIRPVVGETIATGSEFGGQAGVIAWTGTRTRPAAVARAGRDIMAYSRAWDTANISELRLTLSSGQVAALRYDPTGRWLSFTISGIGVLFQQALPAASTPRILAFKMNAAGTRIWLSQEESVLVTAATIPEDVTVTEATGTLIAGVKIDYLTDWEDGGRRVASMPEKPPILKLSALETQHLRAVRGFENVTAEKIISEWCAATLGTVWVDEEGRLNMAARDRLATGKPQITDTLGEKVFAGAWTTARDGIRGEVLVKSQEPHFEGSSENTIAKVYQPENIIELTPNEPKEIFYTLPDEVDMVGLDTNFRPVVKARDGIYDWVAFDAPAGSWWAISFENGGEPEGYRWTGSHQEHEILSASLEALGQRALKMTFKVDTNKSRGIEKYYLVTPTIATGDLRYGNRGVPMPLIRANWVIIWVDKPIRVSSGAPGADFELEATWWLQPEDATRVAQALADEIGQERITFDSLAMLWDPRKQIGDSHTLKATDEAGDRWKVEYILTGYKEAWEGNVPTCSYDLDAKRLTDLRAGKTYADLGKAYGTYGDIPAASYGQVYAALPERSQ
ncbi:hypothetical protein [Rothia nasimurium]|uniref:hypothetical protein n=1 Tax=Rothia nasimurium TaxID=85336 RepID=UPI001F477195|nr:hypothetical protein [Rothia nasimurium]